MLLGGVFLFSIHTASKAEAQRLPPIECVFPSVPSVSGTDCIDPYTDYEPKQGGGAAGGGTAGGGGGGGWGDDETGPNFGCGRNPFTKGCMAQLAYYVMSLFAVLLGIAGVFLNFVIELTIKNLPVFIGKMTSIATGWRIIRDTINIFFIFILLFSAISMILRLGKISPKDILPKLIIAALLINFSMFFTKALIDVSNVFTVEFHNAIEEIGNASAKKSSGATEKISGISAAFMQGLNPQKMFSQVEKATEEALPDYETHIFQQMVFGSITILIATFVFFAMAMMLLVRFVILILLLVTSPIGFVGGLLPQLTEQSKKWWDTLIGQILFAPILMLFMLLTVLIVTDPSLVEALDAKTTAINSTSSAGQFFSFAGGGVAGMMSYFLIIGLMIAGLVISKQISGKAASGLMNWATKAGGAAAFAVPAFIGRNTLGRAGRGMAESGRFNRWALDDKSMFKRFAGTALIGGGKGLQTSSFDGRGSAALKDTDAGKAADGYLKRREAATKQKESYAEKARVAEPRVDAAKAKVRRVEDDIRAAGGTANGEQQATLDAAKAELKRAEKETSWWGKKPERTARQKLSRAASAMSLVDIAEIKQRAARIKKIVDANKTLSNDQKQARVSADLLDELKKLDEVNHDKGRHIEYIEATDYLNKVQKDQRDSQKEWQERLAGAFVGARVVGSDRDLADKLRKKLKTDPDKELLEKVRKLATDEKEPAPEGTAAGGAAPGGGAAGGGGSGAAGGGAAGGGGATA